MPIIEWTDRISPCDSDHKPKVSLVIPARNEYPQILGTILNIVECLEFWDYEYEIIVVSNQSNDGMPEVLEDRFRHWVKERRLKVVYFDDRPACWHARNVGVEVASGDVLVICDGHMSVGVATLHNMIQLWSRYGGLWHSASQMWGDPRGTRLYGYSLKIEEKFWGNLSRHIPSEVVEAGRPPYTIPMAQYSLFLLGRQEFLDVGGFHPGFKCYGGGEPYLAFKWHLLGKRVWMYPKGLVRHAFGLKASWRTARDGARGTPFARGKGPTDAAKLISGKDEVLGYHRGYSWNNDQLWFNFLLCAYVIGGEKWLNQRYERYVVQCKSVNRYLDGLKRLREEAFETGQADRKWILEHQVVEFDDLIEDQPWNTFETISLGGAPEVLDVDGAIAT